MSKTVMITTGESSGELYGALLASELKTLWPGVRVLGVGGERMRRAGVEVFSGIAGAFGLTEALSSYRAVKNTLNRTLRTMEEVLPDVVVLIDYPDFNFRVGRRAKELGLRVLYYVSPQVWAWRMGRVKDMAGFVDKMAVVLPFEEEIYRGSGISCEFVGHPVLDEMQAVPEDKDEAREALGLEPGRPYLALLPGSRRSELVRLLPVLLGTVRKFRKEYPDYGYVMPLAPNLDAGEFRGYITELEAEGVKVREGGAVLAYTASEAAVAASGTAALQAVFRDTPLVVIYRVFPLTYFLGRLILKVKYANIANLILGREAVPELLQGRANPEEIMAELRSIVPEGARRGRMLEDLRAVKAMFWGRNPSQRVAAMAGELGGWA